MAVGKFGFGTCSDFDTTGHLCFMLVFDDFVDFRVLTALSSICDLYN